MAQEVVQNICDVCANCVDGNCEEGNHWTRGEGIVACDDFVLANEEKKNSNTAQEDRTMAKTVEITHNGFHGIQTLRFRPLATETNIRCPENAGRLEPGSRVDAYSVSDRTERRLNTSLCGMSDCTCGECIASPILVQAGSREIRGRYPQD